MDGAAAYLEHATRASSSEDDVEEEPRFGSAFAALAVDDEPRAPRRARASSPPSSSGSDDEGAPWFPPDATADEIVAAASAPGADGAPAWAWSTGRAGASASGATRRADEARRQKKPLLAKGEKRMLKKRHVAETRAARSAKRHGFTPADVKAAFERLAERRTAVPNEGEGVFREGEAASASEVSSRTKKSPTPSAAPSAEDSAEDASRQNAFWRPPNGGVCGVKEAKTIAALARCFPGLRVTAVRGRSNKKRVEVTVERVETPRSINIGARRRAGVASSSGDARDDSHHSSGEAFSAALSSTEDRAARASAIAAPVPTREAFLNDPARLARLAKTLRGSRGSVAAGAEGDARRAPPTTRPGRRGAGAYNAPKNATRSRGRRDEEVFAANPPLRLGVRFAAGGTLEDGHEDAKRDGDADGDDADGGDAECGDADADRPASRSDAPASALRTFRTLPVAAGGDAFGAFERHTSGFGGRMLARMGFTPGEGLGKEKTGVAEPVEASARQKRLGLGADG